MAEAFWTAVAAPFALSAALSFLLERLLRPQTGFGSRPAAAVAAHLGSWALLYCMLLAVSQRPWFAAALALAAMLLLVLVSNAKNRALREHFVFQDFVLFSDALKHPRIHLPYFGIGRAALAFAAFALALWGGIALEPSRLATAGSATFWTDCALLALLGAGLLGVGIWRGLPVCFDPSMDLKRLGLLASLCAYAVAERKIPASLGNADAFGEPRALGGAGRRPHLIVVQSESFFDARRLYPEIRKEVFGAFDAVRSGASCHGRLEVPAWGGNTVRTEFAFLSGLRPAQLEVHRFNPYRTLGAGEVPTLASFLRRAGYRTVCVHPYASSFNDRDRVLPALGFDEFLDIRDFAGAAKQGPFVGDIAVAEKLRAILENAVQPTMVFAITMENHGPLHLEKLAPGDAERLYSTLPPTGFEELSVYLRHLRNADRMIGMLREWLLRSPSEGWLCWYGDHVPVMPRVFEASGFADGRTDYFIWGSDPRSGEVRPTDRAVEDLAALLLEKAGLR